MHREMHWIVTNLVRQPDPQRLTRWHHLRCDKHLQRSRLSNQTWQPLRSTPSGHHAKAGSAMAEYNIRSCDAKIESQCQIHASTHAVAVNCRKDGNRKLVDCRHEPL